MNCEQMTALLSAYVDGELTEQEEMQVQEHLAQCADCRALLEQLQALHTSFSDLEEIPAPEGFAQGVMSRIKAEERPKAKVIPLFKRPQVRAMAAVAACAVLCLGLGRDALLGGMDMNSAQVAYDAPAAAPEAACYDAAEEAPVPAPRMENVLVEMPQIAPDTAPAESNKLESDAQPELTMESDGEVCYGAVVPATMYLNKLPRGAEEELGTLQWEERESDGVLCAHLTSEQWERLLKLAEEQGMTPELILPEGEVTPTCLLVLSP